MNMSTASDQKKSKAELLQELAQLRQELTHLRAFSEVTVEGIVLHEKGLILEVNEALTRLIGFQRAEMLGRPVFDFLAPECWDTVRRHVQNGYDKPYESLLLHKNGAKIPVEFLGKNYFYQGREVRATAVRDISERKLAETQLQQNQQRLELVMEAAGLGAWSLNPQTGEDIVDERAAAMLGYTVAEVEPHISWWDERTHPEDAAHAQEVWNAHVKGQTPFYECEYRVRAKSGDWVWILDRGNIIERDQNGQPLRVVGTHLDITRRKQAEEAFRKSEAINRALFEAMPDLMIRLNRAGTYLDFKVPPGFDTPISAHETVGKNVAEILPPELAQQRLHQIEQALQTGEVQVAEYQLKLPHGIQYEEARIVPAGEDEVLAIVRDITERKRAEQMIIRQQDLLSKIIDILPVGVIVKDVQDDYRFTIWNRKMEEMFGVKREEMLGKTDYDYSPHDQADSYRQTDMAVMEGGQIIEVPVEEITTAQGTRLAHSVKLPIYDSQGKPQLLLATLEDITERKQAEQTIARQRELLNKIIDNLPVGVFAKDAQDDYRFTIFNAKMEEMFGIQRQDMLGKNDYNLFADKKEADSYRQMDISVMGGGQVVDIPVEVVTTQRGTMLSHTTKVPIYDNQGRPQLLLGVLDDITERKQSEEQLRQNEALLRTIIDSTPDWIFIKDQNHRYRLVNQSYAASMHLSPEDFVGKNDLDIGFPEDIVRGNPAKGIRGFWADDRAVMDSGETRVVPEEPAVVDGQPVWLSTIKVPLRDVKGQVWGVLGFVQDITERKQTEQALRAVVEGTAAATGDQFFRSLVQAMAAALEMKYALVTQLDAKANRARTLAFWGGVDFRPNIEYGLEGTPCKNVLAGHIGVYPSRVQQLFPQVQELLALKAESYLGVPLFGSTGQVLGHLVVIDEAPIRNEEQRKSFLQIFAARAGAELERLQTEEALRASEQRLALAMEGVQDGVWEWDLQNGTMYWSPRVKAMLGYNEDEIEPTPTTFDALTHPDDRERAAAALEAHLKHRVPYDVETRSLTKSGEYRWFRDRGQAVWDEAGNPIRMSGATTDITERKQAEEALRESRQRLDLILQGANLGTWDINPQTGEGQVDERAVAMLGYAFDEVNPHLGWWAEQTHPDDLQQARERWDAHIEGSTSFYECEYRLRTKSGEWKWVLDRGQIVERDKNGLPLRVAGTHLDITERKLVEETLRTNEIRNRALLNAIPDLIIHLSKDGTYLDVKAARGFASITPLEDMLGRTIFEMLPPDMAQRQLSYITQALQTSDIQNYEQQLVRENRQVYEEVRIAPSGDDEVVMMIRDITERKQAEEERARLLAEVEAAYRQYVRREWTQFLQERPQMQQVVYQPAHLPTPPAPDKLVNVEAEVLREGKTKALAPVKDNGHSTEPAIVAPLSLRGQVIGALSLQDIDPDRTWTAEEIALVETVSEQLALTLENLRLFEDTQRSAWRDQVVSETTAKVWSAAQIEEVLKTAVAQLGDKLRASEVVIRLGTEAEFGDLDGNDRGA